MRKSVVSVSIIIAASVAAFIFFISNRKTAPAGFVYSSGTVTGDEIMISSKFPGRIKKVYVSRGSDVKKGQILFAIDDKQLIEEKEAQKARIIAEQIRLKELSKSIPSEITRLKDEAKSFFSNYKMLLPLLKNAKKDYLRYDRLLKSGSVSEREAEKIQAAYLSIKQKTDSALSLYRSASNAYIAAKAKSDRIKMQSETIAALKHRLEIISTRIEDSRVKSPVDGIVTGQFHYEGEVVAPGVPVISIINPNKLYLKIFVAESQFNRLKLGQLARIYIEGEKPFKGTVSYIASQAEFTPKNVETKKQRVALVYEVHIALKNRDNLLKNGMIADVAIRIDSSKEWPKSL